RVRRAGSGLAGVVPPVLLAAVDGINGSYSVGLTLLAGTAAAGAAYLHVHRGWIDAAMAFPTAIGVPATGTTIVTLADPQHGTNGSTLATSRLVTLATRQELVIVSARHRRPVDDHDRYSLIAGLRAHLPRHRIIGLLVGATVHPHEIASIVELVADGALPVVRAVPVTTTLQPVGWSRSKESTGWSGGCELVDEGGDGALGSVDAFDGFGDVGDRLGGALRVG